jgi:ADP-heptose:LPS heptosyltransferase
MQSKLHPVQFTSWEAGIEVARTWLKSSGKSPTILVEQNRNMGDTLHLTPIIRHYRLQHPTAAIAFVVANDYLNVHEFNPDVDQLFGVPKLNPQERIKLRHHLLTFTDIDRIVSPSIFPYGEVWPELKWCHSNIANQYFHNAGIPDLQPIGGRRLLVQLHPEDHAWAEQMMANHSLSRRNSCIIEYNSYSGQPAWRVNHFKKFVARCASHGLKCISVCGPNEAAVSGSINCAGITWRQTVALLSRVGSFVGIGSGLTMLAAAADPQPHILEICIEDSINMSGCGYANSLKITNPDPNIVADHLWYKVINQ